MGLDSRLSIARKYSCWVPLWRATYARWVPSGESATAGPFSRHANCSPGGSVIVKHETRCGEGEGFRFQTARLATVAPSSKVHRPKIRARRPSTLVALTCTVDADVICEPPSAIHFNSSHRSLATCHLFSGSLAIHFFTTRSSAGGVMGCSDDIGRGSDDMIAPITLAWLLPSKALLPVAIS